MTGSLCILERDVSLNRKGDPAFPLCVSKEGPSGMDESSKETKYMYEERSKEESRKVIVVEMVWGKDGTCMYHP